MLVTERVYRLLIVDDDETDRRLYGWLLARQAPGQFQIDQAADGASGLAALRAHTYDCVLLDFSLPDVTGLEFLSDTVTNGELPAAFVLITGHGNESIAVDAMKLGVQDYLVKDHVNEGRLWRAIVRAVSQRELRQRLADSSRALAAVNASLEQEIAAHRVTETALRAAKEAAEQAFCARSHFVATLTRELRAPLNGILGYAQLLEMEGELSPRQSSRVGGMLSAGRQVFALMERALDCAGIESGRIALRPVPLQVRDLMESCIASIGPLADARGLSLHLVFSHDAPRRIVADQARSRQLLLILLGNAVKYTATGWVELRVLASEASDRLRIEVADTGPGIKDTERDGLFRDVAHADVLTATDGAGLSLVTAARFVALMGGTIGYRRRPEGGSVFWVELPRDNQARPVSAVATVGAPPRSGSRVLLVDDIAMNRDVIGAFLRNAGHDVRLAESGQDGVRLAAEQRFDVILMDIRMPEMDGLEATRRIRALPEPYGHAPILALTACCLPEQIAACQAAGMDGHVGKPVDHRSLVRKVAKAIARRQQWRDAAVPGDPGERRIPWLDPGVPGQTMAFAPPDPVAEGSRM